ncbi:hypothetical protein BC940DRAFT_268413 [Gongronella butleri]|nr:hypothetical protein BC940DRAFT_268413 [Gongronella butleri]
MTLALQDLIAAACSAARFEPDVALNMEICEKINAKGAGMPRLAAMTIVKLVNSHRVNQALLALTLLDHCVKNCGYPFHLQIATKEFLNALVRKFPERPPPGLAPAPPPRFSTRSSDANWNHFESYLNGPSGVNPVMTRILYMIKEWKIGLAELSRYKNDLIHIKDMYRLLRYKGYRFPEIKDASISALAPVQSLRSAEELEEEDRVAQGAKLQELIRRGRPQDLVEANRLMKLMTGYDQRKQANYHEMFAEELQKIENKANLLYEMLENIKPGERVDANDMMGELQSACASALPKIAKMVKAEEDEDKIEDLLRINDLINNVIAKYQDLQKGIYDTHYDMHKGAGTHGTPAPAEQAISLIDLDDIPASDSATSSNAPSPAPGHATIEMDALSDLFGQVATPSSVSSSRAIASSSDLLQDLAPSAATSNHTSSSTNEATQAAANNSLSIFDAPQTAPAASSASTTTPDQVTLIDKNGLHVVLNITQTSPQWHIQALYSNRSKAPMENMVLHLAAPKSMPLKMSAPSSQEIPPQSQKAVFQDISLHNPEGQPLRLRYKATYEQFGVAMELTGELA